MVAFQIFSGIAFGLLMVPYPLQLRSGNVALALYMTWLLLYVFIVFVNSTIWESNVDIKAKVWCDISTKLQLGAQVALPSCSFAVLKKLEKIASTRQVTMTREDKRRDTIIDLVLGLAIPLVYCTTHVIVQGHRFDLVEGYGPQYSLYHCLAMIFLITIPPLFFILISSVYAGLCLRWFLIRRRQFRAVLLSRAGGLTTSRFIRLLVLTSVEMLISLPAQVVNAWSNLKPTGDGPTLQPYISWSFVHAGFGRIGQITLAELKAYDPTFIPIAEYLRWTVILGAFLAFFSLGCTSENIAQMRLWLFSLRSLLTKRRSAPVRDARIAIHTERETTIPAPTSYQYDDDSEKAIYELKTASPGSASFSGDRFFPGTDSTPGLPSLSISQSLHK